ncbi:MAG: hypothetical protein MJY73_07015 [Bacteroidales bacterium]|nr:hypothetical protein [Bacteroidales bacterium]
MARRLLVILILLLGAQLLADAQSSVSLGREAKGRLSIPAPNGSMEKPIGTAINADASPIEYGKYTDDKLSQLEKEMEAREWGSEDTAWERARKTDTKDAYQRYVAMYPNGAHRPQASQRLVDLSVDDIFNNDHGSLPKMNHVEKDDDSPTSTITIENATRYPLTVMYSGAESKSIVISPGAKSTMTLPNGRYRIAASVPDAFVRPFAGSETFSGGRYETGYVIVRNGWY